MPCTDWGSRDGEYFEKIAELTSLLCELCTAYPKNRTMPETVRLWWKRHQQDDLDRMRQMKHQKRENLARLKRQVKQMQAEISELENGKI